MLVFLDTNAYVGAKYNFETGKLNNLKSLIIGGEISLLITNATIIEIIQHIKMDYEIAIKNYNNILRKQMPALNNDKTYDLHELDFDEVFSSMKKNVMEFTELKGVKKISLNPLDAEKLFEDYAFCRPPFEQKKPNEFKDAIMINAIKNYQKSIHKMIYIVSNDEGFRKAFNENNKFLVFNYLGDFLKYYYNSKENHEIMEYTSKMVADGIFDNVIKEYLNNIDIDIDYYIQCDCKSKEITEISSKLLYIEEEKDKKYAIISSDFEVLVDIIYRNEDMSYYDKEEDKYLFEDYVHAIQKHKVNIETRWECITKTNNKNSIPKIEIKDDIFKYIELNENTLIDNEILDEQ